MLSLGTPKKITNQSIALAGKNQFLGEDDARLENPTYTTTVKCISQKAKVIQISSQDFRAKLKG